MTRFNLCNVIYRNRKHLQEYLDIKVRRRRLMTHGFVGGGGRSRMAADKGSCAGGR